MNSLQWNKWSSIAKYGLVRTSNDSLAKYGDKDGYICHNSNLKLKLIQANLIVKTQRNSTQLKQLKSNFVEVRHGTHLEPTPPHPPPTPNFSGNSRPARELKFGTDTH